MNIINDMWFDEPVEEVVQEEPKKKHAGGRPKGTTKEVLEERKKMKELEEANLNRGNHFAVYPSDRNGQLQRSMPDSEERKKLVSTIIGSTLLIYKQPPCETLEEAEKRTEDYFNVCYTDGVIPTVEGLALCLGVSKMTLQNWEEGRTHPERGPLISRAKEFIAQIDAQLVSMGKMPAVPYIFRAKNFYGMSDKNEINITASPYGKEVNEEQLKKDIRDTIICDDDDYEVIDL